MPVFLFTDIEGSTRLWEEHTPQMGEVIARHDAIVRGQIGSCGGRVTKHTGDGVTAAFADGEPLRCALNTQQQLATEPWQEIGELRVRMGLHAGEAELIAGDYFGPVVNCTSRVMAAAWGGQILLTPAVTAVSALPDDATLIHLGSHLLDGVRDPQQIYQLDHPDLRRHGFPPPRTLSSTAVRRAVGEEGQQWIDLSAPAIAVRLAGAVLLPTLSGDLAPSSPALVNSLGVLADLGAGTLERWLAGFASREHGRQQGGATVDSADLSRRLEAELLGRWQAGGEEAAALRADVSRLLRSLRVVEAAMDAATLEVRSTLAQALAAVGGAFAEFRWMLDGLREAMAAVEARQDVQLSLQREQLDLQREQLAKTDLLLQWQQDRFLPDGTPVYSLPQVRTAEAEVPRLVRRLGEVPDGVIDLPSLTALYASRGEWDIGPREAPLLVRSALHHGVDVQPWLRCMGSPDHAVRVLLDNYEHYPRPQTRQQIVAALGHLEGDAAADALVHVALADDAPDVRAQAALAAADRGRAVEIMSGLIPQMSGPGHAAALAAFVALADVVGIPDDVGPYPRAAVWSALFLRRWRTHRDAILRQTGRAALTGLLVSVFGCATPLCYYFAFPEEYRSLVEGVFPLAAWVVSGALMFMLIGSFQGSASGFALGVADALWPDPRHRLYRRLCGVGSGLALTILLTMLSLWNLTSPEVGPGLYVAVYLICGLAGGAAATLVIPRLGCRPALRALLKRAAGGIVMMAATTIPYAFVLFPSTPLEPLLHRLLYAIGFPLALALLFGRRRAKLSQVLDPTEAEPAPLSNVTMRWKEDTG